MKKTLLTLIVMMTTMVTASGMSYSKARTQALYLTDKMGYELNLSDDQYNAAYEINLDYMMCIHTQADLFGYYWDRRNNELKYVLSAYQYQRFMATDYFYRPINWLSNTFSFIVYTHYPKNKYFLNAPRVYDTYKGGNRQYQHSPYQGRTYAPEPNRNVRPQATPMPQPSKSKSQAVKGARQQPAATQNGHFRTSGNQPQGGKLNGRR